MKLDLSPFSEEQQEALLPVLLGLEERVSEQAKKAEQSQGTADPEELAALKAEVKELREQIAEAKKPAKADDKSKSDADNDAEETLPPAVQARLDEMSAQITKMTEERDGEKSSARSRQLAEQTVQKHHPNLPDKAKARLIERIASASPADEAAAVKTANDVAAEWRDAGTEIKPIGADSSIEPKKKPAAPGSSEARIQSIREGATRGSVV
ncbi:MAG: hypothetical protein NXI14_02065 [bacterium]|nr:hypothetical protein [bacterium]